eukprot:15863-Amphidinium_carterae.1
MQQRSQYAQVHSVSELHCATALPNLGGRVLSVNKNRGGYTANSAVYSHGSSSKRRLLHLPSLKKRTEPQQREARTN